MILFWLSVEIMMMMVVLSKQVWIEGVHYGWLKKGVVSTYSVSKSETDAENYLVTRLSENSIDDHSNSNY